MPAPALAPLNARIPEDLRRQLAVHCAERGITIQEAVRDAIQRYLLTAPKPKTPGYRASFPLIKAEGREPFNVTREQIDEATLGGYERYLGLIRRGPQTPHES